MGKTFQDRKARGWGGGMRRKILIQVSFTENIDKNLLSQN